MQRTIRALRLSMLTAAMTMPSSLALSQPKAFDTALEDADFKRAAEEIDKLVNQQTSKAAKPSLLDAYYGRFFAATGQSFVAEPYLVRAVRATSDGPERDLLAFELARTRETGGLIGKAEADYRQLSQAARTDPTVRRDATLSLARLRLGADPGETIALLTSLAEGRTSAPSRWEQHLLMSRAWAMQGNMTESNSALTAAWQEAQSALSPADAIAVISMDMAINRAAAGDRRGQVGLLSTANVEIRFTGLSQLPVCSDVVRPDDTVTIAVAIDSKRRPLYSAVRASRPGIAQHFTIPLAAASQRIDGPSTYFTLRCRTEPAADIRFAAGNYRNIGRWMAEKGLHPSLIQIDPSAGDPLTQLKVQAQEIEKKAGPDTPTLAPVLLQLSFLQAAQSRFGSSGNFAEAKATAERAIRILTSAEAPVEVLEQVRFLTTVAFAQNQNIADVTGPATLQALTTMLTRSETGPEEAFTAFKEMSAYQVRPTDRIAMSDRLLGFFDTRKVAASAPIRQAVELSRANALRELGTTAGMKDRLLSHGISPELCVSADRSPSIPPSAIALTSEDYPKDLLRRNVMGLSTIELSIAADGKVSSERIVVSQPSGLFDSVTSEKLKAVTLLPAQRDGRPVACRGKLQTVRWQIPFQGDFANPFGAFPFLPGDEP